MKVCPACGTQYADDSLQYCLQDGTPLPGSFAAEAETETVVTPRNRFQAPATQNLAGPRLGARAREPRSTAFIVAATALATLLVLLLAAAGFWIFFSGSADEPARSSRAANRAGSASPALNPTPTSSPSPTPARSPAISRSEVEKIRRDVSAAVRGWIADTESLDIDALMARYAGRADYYNTSNVSRDAIRRDKERAFEAFDTVRMEIADLEIEIDEKGETATAEFDKEWEFDGERSSRGKVRSQLIFRKADGRWLIESERDLRVY